MLPIPLVMGNLALLCKRHVYTQASVFSAGNEMEMKNCFLKHLLRHMNARFKFDELA
jgi:hypothetical protein